MFFDKKPFSPVLHWHQTVNESSSQTTAAVHYYYPAFGNGLILDKNFPPNALYDNVIEMSWKSESEQSCSPEVGLSSLSLSFLFVRVRATANAIVICMGFILGFVMSKTFVDLIDAIHARY